MRVLALACCLLILVPGCATWTGSTPSDEPIPATVARDRVMKVAQGWQEDANLVLLSGFEGGAESPPVARERRTGDGSGAIEDPVPGDGRAPSWTAVVASESANASISLRLLGDQVQRITENTTRPPATSDPLGSWSVDSPEAVETAKGNATFSRIVAAPDAAVFMTLGGNATGVPTWQLVAYSPQAGGRIGLVIDARTGELLDPS